MPWLIAAVIARVLAIDDVPPPDVDDDEVLLLKRHDVVVGCTTGDAGVGGDASVGDAAPADAAPDAGPVDAGVDGGLSDAGPTDAGPGCTMIPGDAVTMVVAPRVHANAMGQRFAMLYVTPSRPVVEVFADAFGSLRTITAPNVVVHEVEVVDPALGTECAQDDYGGCGGGGGGGCESGAWDPPGYGGDDNPTYDGGVSLQTIGPYEILRAQPRDRAELVGWLDQLGFTYEPSDVDAVVPYIARDYHVVAVRLAANAIDTKTTSLALTWAGSALTVPAALNASTHAGSPLTLYVAADGTYSFSGGKIIFSGRISMSGMGMGTTYVTRSEVTLPSTGDPDKDPVAVRILPDVEYQETIEQTHYTHVPAQVNCYDEDPPPEMDDGCCSDCNTHRRVRVDMIVLALVVMFVIRRRRR
ncbi:MAG TPA: DUF2330 domain-containing protein [Kofleriaceae bacterium]|nr:DUF2330 domain-containing protein [Kofleriaceae bacterium]